MFADPVTITLDAPTGAKNLVRINQDSYGSEYLLVAADGLSEMRLKIRHSKETVKVGADAVDRHNVEGTWYVYPTSSYPNGRTRQVYTVIRLTPGDDMTLANDWFEAVLAFAGLEANISKFIAWES